MIHEPLRPEACGTCSACRKSENDPWRCRRPWGVGKLLGPLDIYYDPDTGRKRAKGFSDKSYSRSFDMDTGEVLSYGEQRKRDFFGGNSWSNGGKAKDDKYEKCAHSHPPLEIQPGFTVYGGAASSPVVKDCDIYVSLDSYSGGDIKAYPWNEGGPVLVNFPVTDMQAPKDPIEFKKMVQWLKAQGLAGKKIHIGCIGGHGRTGTLLAALVKEVSGNADAIAFVRKNYCAKAVESDVQVKFLAKEFGIKEQKGAKDYVRATETKSYGGNGGKGYTVEKPSQIGKFNDRYRDFFRGKEVTLPIEPMVKRGSIWSKD